MTFETRILGHLEDALDERLSITIGGVCFSSEDELNGSIGIPENRLEPVGIGEEHPRPLVGGEASGESNREPIGR